MKQFADISVIVPCFNSSKTIRGTIDSVVSQSLAPKEIIVVDDCSTDSSLDMLKTYAKSCPIPMHIIQAKENSGAGAARNLGWEKASGEFIALLDSDDKWLEDKIKLVWTWIKKETEPLAICHGFLVQGKTNSILQNPGKRSEISMLRLLFNNPIMTPCLIIKRSSELRFDPTMRHSEDYELILRLAAIKNVVHYSDKQTLISRPVNSAGGLSENLWSMRKGELKAYWNLAKAKISVAPLLPLLWLWSLTKHQMKKTIRFCREHLKFKEVDGAKRGT